MMLYNVVKTNCAVHSVWQVMWFSFFSIGFMVSVSITTFIKVNELKYLAKVSEI